MEGVKRLTKLPQHYFLPGCHFLRNGYQSASGINIFLTVGVTTQKGPAPGGVALLLFTFL
jgi:hypothetical protein